MLHVLFIILKIIGIALAALLGLLLLLLLLLLFVPIRYKGTLQKEEKLWMKAKVSWLLHVLSIPIVYEEGAFHIKLKLFGITLKDLTREKEELEQDVEGVLEEAETSVNREEEIYEKEKIPLTDLSKENGGEEIETFAQEKENQKETDKRSDSQEKLVEKITINQRHQSFIKKLFYKIKRFLLKLHKIWEKIRNLKYTFQQFYGKIKKGVQKCQNTKEFLLHERTKNALRQCFFQGKLLVQRLFPKKIRGELWFGTEDPALTGKILGGISIFYPIFMDNVRVYPDFEQALLKGELFAKGRLCLATVGWVLWRLWRDRDVRYVYQKLFGSKSGNV